MNSPVHKRKFRASIALSLLCIAGGAAYLGFTSANYINRTDAHTKSGPKLPIAIAVEASPPECITLVSENSINIPEKMMAKMGLRIGQARMAADPISLPSFQGILALDNDRLSRVYSRFNGEAVQLGKSKNGDSPLIRVGERVKKGDLLLVIWSSELGEKKSELVDVLVKLHAEEQLRDRLKSLFKDGAVSGRNYHDVEKEVQARKAEVASLERTLRTWRITEEDFEDIREEVKHLTEAASPQVESSDWARVEIRSPIDGVILEKNVVVGDIVSTEMDLFKIGELSQLVVWAHVYEDDLPLLESLPTPLPWTLSLPSKPGYAFTGTLDKIGAIIDPTQHTALVSGSVQNPLGHLKVGQFVTANVMIPPAENELEIPATAVVEDGRQSIVFVQNQLNKSEFSRRAINVDRRLQSVVYISSSEIGLGPNDYIVTSGSILLHKAMSELPALKNNMNHIAESSVTLFAPQRDGGE